MTEAAHQMASNPLPPRRAQAGLGRRSPAGPEVAIMDRAGAQPARRRRRSGEIVIRGANVTAATSDNPEANARRLRDGWFRTGDQGYLDDDGYLFITGRLKEIINRGGEKIAPREVDEVLLEHPAVAQARDLRACPMPTLGEDVAAAVVLRPGTAAERRTPRVAVERLAAFKVPRRVVVVPDPQGPHRQDPAHRPRGEARGSAADAARSAPRRRRSDPGPDLCRGPGRRPRRRARQLLRARRGFTAGVPDPRAGS